MTEGQSLLIVGREQLSSIITDAVGLAIKNFNEQQQKPPEDKLLSVAQASEFLDLTPGTIYVLNSQSKIPSIKRGKKLYFSKDALKKWNENGRPPVGKSMDEIVDEALASAKKLRKRT